MRWPADFGVEVFADNAEAVRGRATLGAGGQAAGHARGLRRPVAPIAQSRNGRWWSRSPPASPPRRLERWLGGDTCAVDRALMPNTPALLGAGRHRPVRERAGRCAGPRARRGAAVQRRHDRLDRRRGADGCGHRGVRQRPGLCVPAGRGDGGGGEGAKAWPDDAARTLVLQTVLGAARMLTESDEAPAELRRRVTSPSGTTQAAIETFEAGGLRDAGGEGDRHATERGRQLSAAND